MKREHLGSRLGFILLSAGCAIGCGNVWKFPWLTGQYGGGVFVFVYLICLLVLGLPVMVMEIAMGRASQASPVKMYQKLEKPGQKWHIHGYFALLGNVTLMAFYSVVAGWMIYYFIKYLIGENMDLGFGKMLSNPAVNVGYLLIVVILGFLVLSFGLKNGLERIAKYMMIILFILLIVLAVRSCFLPGAKEGIKFYLLPDFGKINFEVIVAAMNQAFFSLSTGVGTMAILGSYTDKKYSLLGESIRIVSLDTLVAIISGLVIFPSCFTYNQEVQAGPSLLFDTMALAFNNMQGGRMFGTIFFLFMVFAAISTVFTVFENILACFRELTNLTRPKASVICGVIIFIISLTTALGYNLWSGFVPFAEGSSWLDFWDFITSINLLPLGSLIFAVFCTNKRFGWGWDNFIAEANIGIGLKIKSWMKPIFTYVVPVGILFLYIYGMVTFDWK